MPCGGRASTCPTRSVIVAYRAGQEDHIGMKIEGEALP